MALGKLLSAASNIAAPVWDAACTLASKPGGRRAWSRGTNTHLETKGMHTGASHQAGPALEARLSELAGVRSAEVNAVLERVVVSHDPEVILEDKLAEVVAEFEHEYGLAGTTPGSAHHPGNAGPLLREVTAFGVSLAGLGYSAATALLPVRTLPPVVPAMISLADAVPWLRNTLDDRLGRPITDTAFAAGGALSQTLAQRPISLFTDVCQRFCTSRELVARHLAWQRWEDTAAGRPGVYRAEPVTSTPRPLALPSGPVERVANVSGAVALTGYGTVLTTLGSPQRALAALLAGTPRAGKAGREAFAAQLTTTISSRECLVFGPDALRRLDRVDTVVLDAPVLLNGRKRVDSVVPLDPDADSAELFARATELVDPADPKQRTQHDEWSSGPVSEFPGLPREFRAAAHEEIDRGTTVVVLSHRSRAVALVQVISELDPLAEALVEVAGAAGSAVVAGVGSRLDRRLPVDGAVHGGNRLAESVRELQADGRVVAVVSARGHSALATADVGLGLAAVPDRMPWGAHVMCPGISEVHTLLAAIDNARCASKRSAGLSVAGSCLGAVFGALGPATGAPTRASMPVNAAALGALGLGTWSGMRAGDHPPPVAREHTPWHALPPDAVVRMLASSPEGLDEAEARGRQQPRPPDQAEAGIARTTLEGLINPMTPVLGAGAMVSAGLGSIVDSMMILFVMGSSALVDGVHQVATNRELWRLLDAGQLPARVRRRNADTRTVPADQLVPGDVVELHAGDGVPADCRLLETEGLELDESSLTGESQSVGKTPDATTARTLGDRTCMLYQGTVVVTGRASAIVVATGTNTELGRTTQDNGAPAAGAGGVEARLSELTKSTLPLSAGAGVLLMVVDLLRGTTPGQAIGRAVGLAVAAVPEGLPFVATVAELAAARRLSTRGVLVRSPSTIEALGRVDALCFDKTGTLTQGRISLRQVSDGTTAHGPERLDPWLRDVVDIAVRASPREQDDRPLPHPTDQAVLDGARSAGSTPSGDDPAPIAELQFEPSRGYHAVCTSASDGALLSVKGAPEIVLDRCSRRRRPDGHVPFDGSVRAEIDDEIERLALHGYRVLAVAERTAVNGPELDESDVDNLDFAGLLALADPVHPTAAEAVGRLQRASVDVIMITGDHPSTAEAIAAELDMLGGKRVVNGAELEEMADDELAADLPKIAVFARVSPVQKARIVRQLRATDRVVAMTGDGANDVPAIRLAHVGIALGSHATPAARESADLVIADDRIETITAAIVEGRGMWASVHDALSILLGGNLGEIAFTLGAGLMGGRAALNTRQLLVVNLLTDVLPALAVAVRPPPHATPDRLLTEGPESSLGTALNRDVYARAAATAGAASVAWLITRPLGTVGQARTAGLVALVSAQLGQTLAMRGRTPLVLAAGGASMVVLTAVVQVPGVSQFFGSQPLFPHQWAFALGAAIAATAAVTLWQAWPVSTEVPEALPAGS